MITDILYCLFIFILVMLFVFIPETNFVLAENKENNEILEGSAVINLDKVINNDIIGAGVNFAFSDYQYINFPAELDDIQDKIHFDGEWNNIHSQHLPFPDDKTGWKSFYELMDFMNFQFVRLGVGLTQWEPVNDDDDPFNLNLDSGFVFSDNFREKHPEINENVEIHMDLMDRLMNYFEKNNTYVILGNWNLGVDWGGGTWLSPNNDRRDAPYDIDEFTEALTAIVYHLKKQKEYKSLKGISMWNEPEQFQNLFFRNYQKDNYFETLAKVYNSLGEQLTRYGLRDKIKIIGLDGALLWNRLDGRVDNAILQLLDLAGDNIDVISGHNYTSVKNHYRFGQPKQVHGTIESHLLEDVIRPALEQIEEYNDSNNRDIPLVIGEFGSHAYPPGDEKMEPEFAQRLHNAEATIELFNNGAKAVAYWIFNNNHHAKWRMLTFSRDKYLSISEALKMSEEERENAWREYTRHIPEDINYYPLALTMKYIQRGSDIIESEVKGFKDAYNTSRVYLTAARRNEDITLLMVNDSEKTARIKLEGLPQNRVFKQYYVAEDTFDKINYVGEYQGLSEDKISLEAKSITVLTTYDYGSERPDYWRPDDKE